MKECEENMKGYVGNMKKYVENMGIKKIPISCPLFGKCIMRRALASIKEISIRKDVSVTHVSIWGFFNFL